MLEEACIHHDAKVDRYNGLNRYTFEDSSYIVVADSDCDLMCDEVLFFSSIA